MNWVILLLTFSVAYGLTSNHKIRPSSKIHNSLETTIDAAQGNVTRLKVYISIAIGALEIVSNDVKELQVGGNNKSSTLNITLINDIREEMALVQENLIPVDRCISNMQAILRPFQRGMMELAPSIVHPSPQFEIIEKSVGQMAADLTRLQAIVVQINSIFSNGARTISLEQLKNDVATPLAKLSQLFGSMNKVASSLDDLFIDVRETIVSR